METTRLGRGERRFAILFSVALLGLVLAPVQRHLLAEPQDSFPLSHYPMFSTPRPPTYWVTHFVVLDADKQRHDVSYDQVGDGGLNVVRRQLLRITKGTPDEHRNLCAKIAARLAEEGDADTQDWVELMFLWSRYRLHDYARGKRTPERELELARCTLPGRSFR